MSDHRQNSENNFPALYVVLVRQFCAFINNCHRKIVADG